MRSANGERPGPISLATASTTCRANLQRFWNDDPLYWSVISLTPSFNELIDQVTMKLYFTKAIFHSISLTMPGNSSVLSRLGGVNRSLVCIIALSVQEIRASPSGWPCLIKDLTRLKMVSLGKTSIRNSNMPDLTEEDIAFVMNSIYDWLPSFHLLFSPYSRSVFIASLELYLKH